MNNKTMRKDNPTRAIHSDRESEAIAALTRQLQTMERVGVAVSGGVDSMTLSFVAHHALGARARMYHAVSPAVPADATARVRDFAAREHWALEVFDAGEFKDATYRANPVNRCYYCKQNLYTAIVQQSDLPIVSGTNLDDLGDYRPGLHAAKEHGVRHPYVEAGIDKQGVRRIARALELGMLAELPAAPCLASRIETGITIEPDVLVSIHTIEKLVQQVLAPQTVRCRLRRAAIVIELDPATLARVPCERYEALSERIAKTFRGIGIDRPVEFLPYRMGSAFLR